MSPVTEVLLRQIYFTGFQAVPSITFSGLLIGFIIVFQTINIAGAGSSNLIGKILYWLILNEIGPFFTGLIILARSGSAISTELSTMKLNSEIYYLEAMGIKPEVYLISTRVYGVVISSVVLSIYFQLTAMFGGIFLATLISGIHFSEYGNALLIHFKLFEIIVSLIKASIFGFVIALVCIWHGLSVKKSLTEIPQRTTKAIMGGLFSIFIVDVIMNFITEMIK